MPGVSMPGSPGRRRGRRRAGYVPRTGASGPMSLVAEASFADEGAYAAFAEHPLYQAVSADSALVDAKPRPATRILALLHLKDSITKAEVEAVAERLLALGLAAVPGAAAVAVGADLRLPGPDDARRGPATRENHDLAVEAAFPGPVPEEVADPSLWTAVEACARAALPGGTLAGQPFVRVEG